MLATLTLNIFEKEEITLNNKPQSHHLNERPKEELHNI
jgi:hypothetical protein